ncbi:glycosyl hydrolase [Catellatospora sp. TT07R-123]|uniref:WD40/YVTN/BNR-like repeat-containing protein n=1 Tax=Catellatospora sp. TT07R-123 TaxID=2733863 RepID=UPI001B2DFC25|nr:exo-alpha-sialidase [Catellatospora sp. TT07R-123]GHJ49922.1 glycosyl hydrolase [Catellatospora sp. TT07R-123]
MTVLLLIGTAKGLFLARRDRVGDAWDVSVPQFPMTAVYAVGVDTRRPTPRLLAGIDSSHFGPSVAVSDDLGGCWREPDHAPLAFPADTGAALRRVWAIAPGPAAEPDVVWAGTEPGAVFRSINGGVTYDLVRGLWDHPHRPRWDAGFGGQAFHTVLPHPTDPQRVLAAISTGGVYRSEDGGDSWHAANTGIQAVFLPEPQRFPEFGQCVHKVARDAEDPERLYLQNHHGVYRSDDDGRTWHSIAGSLPSDFGFPIVAHPHRGGTVWNFPLTADAQRFPVDFRCRVFRTTDAGATWSPQAYGLPTAPFYPSVLRDAMCADGGDPAGVYFGTRTGEVYASADEGDSWALAAAHLPDVLCVRAVRL